MDIKQLQQMGAFVPQTLYKREIAFKYRPLLPKEEWASPESPEYGELVDETATVHIRKRNSADFLDIVYASDQDKPFLAILKCVCKEDGSPVFESLDQVKSLQEWLLVPLLDAVNAVNHTAPKGTPRATSGASLPSPSADGQSQNGSKRSLKKKG